MKTPEARISIDEAGQFHMVDYFSKLGHSPTKIRNADYWYLSPLSDEKNASFKVNRKLNCWYDHGIGKGGNLIDFAILYHKCTISEFLKILIAIYHFNSLRLYPPNTKNKAPKAE